MTTTSSENENTITVIQESEKKDQEISTSNEQEQRTDVPNEIEEKNNPNDDTTINPDSTTTATTTVNNTEDDKRSKRPFNSKVKYSSMSYHRSPYYTNGHPYGPAPYYYYQPVAPIHEKPPSLMVIPTQSSATDNQISNSTTVSPPNLPPRLRQTSANENDTNVPLSSSSSSQPTTTSISTSQPTTNGRRHRSILPRASSNYYSPYPPPLMATPPGVLYPYQPGHIAYNIRPPDELELLALQQQFMGLPPPIVWPPPPAYPHFPVYSMYGPSPYMHHNSSTMDSNNSFLNPEAAEWVPNHTDTEPSSSNDNIIIDDEINFPPLNNTNNRVEDNNTEQKLPIESSPSVELSADKPATSLSPPPPAPATKVDSTSQDDNRHLSASSKLTTISYSTVILQTPDRTKADKIVNTNNNQQARPHHVHVQSPNKQRTQIRVSKEITSRRRQVPSNRNNFNGTRNYLSTEVPKQTQSTDDWIEVKSKKTKKFDRSTNENPSQRLVSDEPTQKPLSPPSSLSSTGDNTTTTCTSEEEETPDKKLVMIVENKTITTTTDYNQVIVNDIHQRLNDNERLLIIIRGCPGSGKSTLAKSLNHGYQGQILSIDEYFQDMNSNEYLFDPSKLEQAHDYNRRLASDAFKRNISPIIIDNTNTTSWEMKPYVMMGKEAGYDILLIEPQTPWRYKPRELVKRNLHNLPLRRIREILNRFERNVTVQSIIDQLKTNLLLPCQSQSNFDQNYTDTESIDPILISKKSFDIIDDSTILDDVRLCINDMILFLTSNFYQTSLSTPSPDLPLVSSSTPTTPSTPHSLFYRSFSRLSSTTSNQDHSFSNDHLLRLPTSSFSRCFENLTPPLSANASIIGKKRRKNKTKQPTNELLLNTNNNNNNNNQYPSDEEESSSSSFVQSTYQVYLPEDNSDFIIIDEHTLDNLTSQENSSRNHSSKIPSQQKTTTTTTNQKTNLLNIIHDQLTQPSISTDRCLSRSTEHIAVQCSPNDFIDDRNSSDRTLIGHALSPTLPSPPIPPPPGFTECGIQVDLNESNINSLASLIEFYSELVSSEIVTQFYELCHSDIQWTRTQIDDYLQNRDLTCTVPTLRQLSLNALNQWNEQLKSSNPSFDTISIGDLLEDINDDEAFEEFTLDDETDPPPSRSIELSDTKQMTIPWSLIDSLQELYGKLPSKSTFSYTSNGLSLPLDDELSMNIYQALQRVSGVSNKETKPVNKKKLPKENKKSNKTPPSQQQQWTSPVQKNSTKKTDGPSLKDIMNEELKYIKTHKQTPKRQLDFASQHKLKELEQHFPSFTPDVLYDIFSENESDYDLTFVCISSMLDENASISTIPKSQSVPSPSLNTRPTIIIKSPDVPEFGSFEISRRDAHDHALKRKECYNKADQANRQGMTGVVSFYINQAREQTRLMKEANRQACEYLSQIRLTQFRQTHRLDLHELHADEALHLFQQVEQELSEGNRRTTSKSIEIITGYGKHSPYGGGCGKIRSVILAYLRQKNYKYSEPNKGAILVQL